MADAAGLGSQLPRALATTWAEGQPALRVELPCGDSALVALQGGQLLSWVSGGREHLFLSPLSQRDGQAAIRGGVPICFPQFNQRGPAAGLPKHGFARNLPWVADALQPVGQGARLVLRLRDSAASRAWWPEAFALALVLDLQPGSVQTTLQVHNPGATAWAFTGALHSYLAVDDVAHASLAGLQGQSEWDAVADVHGTAAVELGFGSEFDRVYAATPAALALRCGGQQLQITQSASWAQTVVWNPGPVLGATLADLLPGGWRQMLCVEAAQVLAPIALEAGQTWTGWQRLARS